MKKSIKVVIMILAVVMMASCEVGEGELMKTKTGHLMYLGWTDDINGILFNIVEPAFNLNAWVQAPENQKPEILRKHFYGNAVIDGTLILTTVFPIVSGKMRRDQEGIRPADRC